ncbi:MAG: hypothetical protein N2379_02625 [Verrucomicrobiae bacterium]|nr:hypothetical protein [Verrucomicrobiae bacterium]
MRGGGTPNNESARLLVEIVVIPELAQLWRVILIGWIMLTPKLKLPVEHRYTPEAIST